MYLDSFCCCCTAQTLSSNILHTRRKHKKKNDDQEKEQQPSEGHALKQVVSGCFESASVVPEKASFSRYRAISGVFTPGLRSS